MIFHANLLQIFRGHPVTDVIRKQQLRRESILGDADRLMSISVGDFYEVILRNDLCGEDLIVNADGRFADSESKTEKRIRRAIAQRYRKHRSLISFIFASSPRFSHGQYLG